MSIRLAGEKQLQQTKNCLEALKSDAQSWSLLCASVIVWRKLSDLFRTSKSLYGDQFTSPTQLINQICGYIFYMQTFEYSRKFLSREQTKRKVTSGQRILNRFSSIFQCFKMKSQAICVPTWLFSATLPITNGASDDLIILEFREN